MKSFGRIKTNLILFCLYVLPLILIVSNYLYRKKIYKSIISEYEVIYFSENINSLELNNSELKYISRINNNNEINNSLSIEIIFNSKTILKNEINDTPKGYPYLVVGNFDLDIQKEILLFNITNDVHNIIDFYMLNNELKLHIGQLDSENNVYKYIKKNTGYLGGISDIIPLFIVGICTISIFIIHVLANIIIYFINRNKVKKSNNYKKNKREIISR